MLVGRKRQKKGSSAHSLMWCKLEDETLGSPLQSCSDELFHWIPVIAGLKNDCKFIFIQSTGKAEKLWIHHPPSWCSAPVQHRYGLSSPQNLWELGTRSWINYTLSEHIPTIWCTVSSVLHESKEKLRQYNKTSSLCAHHRDDNFELKSYTIPNERWWKLWLIRRRERKLRQNLIVDMVSNFINNHFSCARK